MQIIEADKRQLQLMNNTDEIIPSRGSEREEEVNACTWSAGGPASATTS